MSYYKAYISSVTKKYTNTEKNIKTNKKWFKPKKNWFKPQKLALTLCTPSTLSLMYSQSPE